MSAVLSNNVLILGFFDGIHLGHRKVIADAVGFAKKCNAKAILLTFPSSPAEYFHKGFEYIYERKANYEILKSLGVDEIDETDFSELAEVSAYKYLELINKKYNPNAIFTGFNYTFGNGKEGNSEFLNHYQNEFGYKYFCVEPVIFEGQMVSSTLIKNLLISGDTVRAANLLSEKFKVRSKVISGKHIGTAIGFPTANMHYPDNIIKLPYGVYKVRVLNKAAIANWGVKPTVNGAEPMLEVHIPDFDGDLYGQILEVEFYNKIRDEKKFSSLEDLKIQIKQDLEVCLK